MASGAGTPAGSGVVGMANRLVQMQMQMQMQQGQGAGQFSLIRPGLMNAMNRLPQPGMAGQEGEEEDNAEEEEDMGVAETYSDYMPSKLKLGRKHPDPVVYHISIETASLASVAPPDVVVSSSNT